MTTTIPKAQFPAAAEHTCCRQDDDSGDVKLNSWDWSLFARWARRRHARANRSAAKTMSDTSAARIGTSGLTLSADDVSPGDGGPGMAVVDVVLDTGTEAAKLYPGGRGSGKTSWALSPTGSGCSPRNAPFVSLYCTGKLNPLPKLTRPSSM